MFGRFRITVRIIIVVVLYFLWLCDLQLCNRCLLAEIAGLWRFLHRFFLISLRDFLVDLVNGPSS